MNNKIINKKILLLLLLLPFIISGCSGNGLSFRYYLNKGNEFFNKDFFLDAKTEYKKAIKQNSRQSYLAKNNQALAEYRENKFLQAKKILIDVVDECRQKKLKFCDQVFYNYGNILYRLGEQEENKNQKINFWQKAIKVYKNDLTINKNDVEAQENIDFILNKIKKLKNNNKNTSSSGKNNNNKQKQGQNSNQTSEQSKQKQGQEQKQNSTKSTNNNKKNSSQNKTTKKTSSKSNNKNQNQEQKQGNSGQSLSKKENKELNQYMQQMDKRQEKLNKYFHQQKGENKSQNSNNPFDIFGNFMNDPFFRSFFNQQPLGSLPKKNSNQKDW